MQLYLKVEEWRCGQLIGEIFRDIPIIVRDCTPNQGLCPQTGNNPPSIKLEVDTIAFPNAPAVDSVTNAQGKILYYSTTVYAQGKDQLSRSLHLIMTSDRTVCFSNITFSAAGGNLSNAANWGNPNILVCTVHLAQRLASLNGNPPGSVEVL